jgi:hypothetical protein
MTLLLVSILAAIILCCPILRRAVFVMVQVVGGMILVAALLIGITVARAEEALTETDKIAQLAAIAVTYNKNCKGPKFDAPVLMDFYAAYQARVEKFELVLKQKLREVGSEVFCEYVESNRAPPKGK